MGQGDVSTGQFSEQSFRGGYIKIPLEISHYSKVPETFVRRVSSVDRETEDFVISIRMDSIGGGHKVLGLQALASIEESMPVSACLTILVSLCILQ